MQVSSIANNYLRSVTITKEFDLPIITRIVLKEVQELIFNGTNKKGVPFYSEGSSSNNFTYL